MPVYHKLLYGFIWVKFKNFQLGKKNVREFQKFIVIMFKITSNSFVVGIYNCFGSFIYMALLAVEQNIIIFCD